MNDRLAFPAAAVLGALTLALWLHLLLFQAAGVRVVNRSGAVLGGLTVCQGGGACLHRDRLWPHQTWRVPLETAAAGQVRLTVGQVHGKRRSAPQTLTARDRTSFVVGQGGRIELQ